MYDFQRLTGQRAGCGREKYGPGWRKVQAAAEKSGGQDGEKYRLRQRKVPAAAGQSTGRGVCGQA